MAKIRTALLSVYDKTGVVQFASALAERGVRLVSTGGTARALRRAGLPVTPVEEFTGAAEMLGGRVKTLHPRVFGGVLARRDSDEQMQELEAAGGAPIDLVAVNLYPFRETVARPGHTLGEALEQIDIGGVSLLRAAYKNFPGVTVVVDPGDYDRVVAALAGGGPDGRMRLQLARKAVAHTAAYEAAIADYLTALAEPVGLEEPPALAAQPETLALTATLRQPLRYGENPHQPAAYYAVDGLAEPGFTAAEQLHGREMSFNNFLDAEAAWRLVHALPRTAAVVVKHANPCGAALGGDAREAYVRARAGDPTSAFGGIVGVNVALDVAAAEEILSTFIEVVVAPEFEEAALAALRAKPNVRLLRVPAPGAAFARVPELRWVGGGLLRQAQDVGAREQWRVAGRRPPSEREERDLRFVWAVVPAVKSNAIVIGREQQLIGVGAGQMSRVDACRIAVDKARRAGHELGGAVAASDAFFPFPDGLEVLAEAGVTAVVQPGGSRRDAEVVAAADRLGVALVHTGARHFRH